MRPATAGMPKARVHRIFDTRGRLLAAAGPDRPRESHEYRMLSGRCAPVDCERRNGVRLLVDKGALDDCSRH